LRQAVAAKYHDWYAMAVDPDSEVTVTCGATEAMVVAMLALVDPGDEVIVFEPFYENYGPDAILSGARPVFVPLPTSGSLDLDFGLRFRRVPAPSSSTPPTILPGAC